MYKRQGGGWGTPLKREPEKVYFDYLDEIISKEAAAEVYGVILTESGVDKDVYKRQA